MEFSTRFINPSLTGLELHNISLACFQGTLGEGGEFSKKVVSTLKVLYENPADVVVTSSVGSSFDLVADLINIMPGDEIILPSFTFVSAANAFAKRGARLIFADVCEEDLNISSTEVGEIISQKTRAIIVPNYAGIPSKIHDLISIASTNNIIIIIDLTGSFLAENDGELIGKFGDFACGSFHEDEYVHSGEGGFLLINNESFKDRCDVIKFRGTNKLYFNQGKVAHYGWAELGGEYFANEITCAFLSAQLDQAMKYREERMAIWKRYQDLMFLYDKDKLFKYIVEIRSAGNFYVRIPTAVDRTEIISGMARVGIECRGHFYPLHITEAGAVYGTATNRLSVTEIEHGNVLRLPSHVKVSPTEQDRIVKVLLRLVENSLTK